MLSMLIERGRIAGVVLSLIGDRMRGLKLDGDGLAILGPSNRRIGFREISAAAGTRRNFPFASLSVPLADGSQLSVRGIDPAMADEFAAALNAAWLRALAVLADAHADEIEALDKVALRMDRPLRYPAACLLEPFLERARRLFAAIPINFPAGALADDRAQAVERIAGFHRDPTGMREKGIADFVERELREMGGFFDRIETNPLTPEHREAVVTDEDATLVLAGAGSGKTSVIAAKAAYLLERGIRRPDEILLLAFGKDAATEMAERIRERCGASVEAKTFHALAHGIIGEAEGRTPALAPHASDDARYSALLREILVDLASTHAKTADLLVRWFAEHFRPERSEWDFASLHDYYSYVEEQELRALQGERVRSFEELLIANWLYVNGIAYEYEPVYEHSLPDSGRGAYTPDFRLTESGVYVEHFGVRKGRRPDGEEILTTAPFVDRESYVEDMEWKRRVHAENGTILVETYSYERVEGRLLLALESKLKPYAECRPLPRERIFERLTELGQIDSFTRTLGTFLRHFKESGRSIEDCRARVGNRRQESRERAFLDIFEQVFERYRKRQESRIDFEDMISLAASHVRAGRWESPYRHILVDEFQDISQGRADLLRALLSRHDDARLFAVGDDWQSIYRFAGSDIGLMRNFGREFGGRFAGESGIHRSVDLGRTFRSVDRIALPARAFVLKNPSQIAKNVIPAGSASDPAIRIDFAPPGQADAALRRALADIPSPSANGGETASVLLTGRYRHLLPINLSALKKEHPRLSIGFRTVHASKGLEADHVVVLDAASGRLGFPSEIVDDPAFDLVLPEPENYPHAEERRVFYVALTRARKSVAILAPKDRPSAFARELAENPEYGVREIERTCAAANRRCPACGGRLNPAKTGKGGLRFICEHEFHCGTSRPACPVCDADLPERSPEEAGAFVCSCGERFTACRECRDGWLVERKGRYGPFLGCVNYPLCRGRKRIVGLRSRAHADRNPRS